ncbi:hypothetical protein [Paenibacillus albidus]|uniref:hypothetical protein n=1 Tax=Paenibacillus albidus TaxID=2041023 RepID=UPI001665F98D|nr:hypothetical protein [Paenibacillus albidus]
MYIANFANIEIQACSAFPDVQNAAKPKKSPVYPSSDAQNAAKWQKSAVGKRSNVRNVVQPKTYLTPGCHQATGMAGVCT